MPLTFPKACAAMKRGEHVYRPGWPAGTFLAVRNIRGGDVVCKYEGNRHVGMWLSEPGDLIADDWKCEEYVIPAGDYAHQQALQPGA